MDGEVWVDSKGAGEHLGVSPEWLVANLRKLQIPHTRLNRQYRFRKSDLDLWIKSQERLETV
jgi:excisionase family DNA binding protein